MGSARYSRVLETTHRYERIVFPLHGHHVAVSIAANRGEFYCAHPFACSHLGFDGSQS